MPARVLFVTPEAPYPVLGGGAQRIVSLIDYARGKGAEVDLLTFAPCPVSGEFSRVMEIPLPCNGRTTLARVARNAGRLLRGVPPLVDRLARFDAEIARLLHGQRYDRIFVEHFWLGPYVDVLGGFTDEVICDLHNVESEFFWSLSRSTSWPANLAHRRFARLTEGLERKFLPRYHRALVTSEADAERVKRLAPDLPVTLFPNTIPWREASTGDRENLIVFSGNLEYHPNQQAVNWFFHSIWPELKKEAGLRWRLVGMNPEAVAAMVTDVEMTGAIPDAMAEIAKARVAVVPLLSGSGTRVKILEAWAAGTPVVSTRIGAEGLPGVDGEHFLLADSPADFAFAVKRLLHDQHLASRLSAAGRVLYEKNFHREAAWRVLDAAGIYWK